MQIKAFAAHGDNRQLRVNLSKDRLQRYAAGVKLTSILSSQGVQRAHYFRVAALGRIERAEDSGYELHLDSLFNIALTPQFSSRGRSAKSSTTTVNN